MSIEPGEYFHRETLTAVTVEGVNRFRDVASRPDSFRDFVECKTPVGADFGVEPEKFLRDYARNEPVSGEVFERCGFRFVGGYRDWQIQVGETAFLTYEPQSEDFFFWLSTPGRPEGYLERRKYLPAPATLRDLLNVLRVFGVETPPVHPPGETRDPAEVQGK